MAAIVAVPIPQLASTAEALIAAGLRRILLEKPAGLNLVEIERVADAARLAAADVFVAYNRRFYSSVATARAIIAEDGGVSSFHVDFTEMAERFMSSDKHPSVLTNWFLANSSHVLDLAFHLGGRPIELTGMTGGNLAWHPAGAIFAGYGRTAPGALFTWHADWTSAGRWGLDLRTRKRRLLLQPLESLQVQEKGSFVLTEIRSADSFDSDFKPGVYRQMQAFLQGNRNGALPSIGQHLELVRNAVLPILHSRKHACPGPLPGAAA
jgi:predicted dehydrogenase